MLCMFNIIKNRYCILNYSQNIHFKYTIHINMGYVYLLYDSINQMHKIGVSMNIQRRLKQLQTGNPTDLQLVSYFQSDQPFKIEQMLHNKLKQKRFNNEWFVLDKNDVDTFFENCQRQQNIINSLKDNPYF